MKRLLTIACLALVAGLGAGCASTNDRPGEFLPGYARALAWSPDARHIIALRAFNLVVHDAATLKPLLTREPVDKPLQMRLPAAAVAFAPDGKTFATAGFDGGVVLWDAATWSPSSRLAGAEGATTLAFTPDGKALVVAGPDIALMVFDLLSGKPVATMVEAPSGIMALTVSPDGSLLATGERTRQVRLWQLPGNEPYATVQGYVGPVLSVAYSPDGMLLATAAGGREVRLLAAKSPDQARKLIDPQNVTTEQASRESAASALVGVVSLIGMVRSIQLVGAPTVVPVAGIRYQEWPPLNCPLAFSADGRFLATIHHSFDWSGDFQVEVYEVASSTRISRYTGGISSLAFSPDGRRLAVSGILGIILLDPLTGKEIRVER